MSEALPRVRARRGQISSHMQHLAKVYKEEHPDEEVRFVRDPRNRPEHSKVLQRQIEGYSLVMGSDVEANIYGQEKDQPIRVGDVVMMAIPKELRDEAEAQSFAEARRELKKVQPQYYDKQKKVETADRTGEIHRSKPIGKAVIEEKEFEYEIDQDSGSKDDGE